MLLVLSYPGIYSSVLAMDDPLLSAVPALTTMGGLFFNLAHMSLLKVILCWVCAVDMSYLISTPREMHRPLTADRYENKVQGAPLKSE